VDCTAFAYGGFPLLEMAINVAFIYSTAALFLPQSSTFFWELVTLIHVMLLGHWLEILKRRYARGEITKSEYEEMRQDLVE
jgi:Cu2+-exporting ATPase